MGEKRPNSSEMDEKFKPCDTRDEPRKVFVGGLTRNTNIDVMKAYFGYYGNIIDAIVMVDDDGHSRGFGFVTFDNSDSVEKVLQHPVHFLDGKQVDVKRSVPKALRPPPRQLDNSKKAFLGGLPTDMNEADLREFFSIYGKVTDCVIMYDEKTMKSRGFGFIGFEDETIIDKLLKQQHIQIRHKQVEVKLARPRTHPSVFNAAAAIMGYGTGAGAGGGSSAVPMIGPRMPAGMGGGSQQQQQYGASGYDYNAAVGGYGSAAYNYAGAGGYNYGNNGTTAGGTDPPTKRMKGQGGGDRQAQQQQYPQNYQYPQQYNYDPYGNYYGNYAGGGGTGTGTAQNPYQNYQYPSQYYGGGGDGKDGSVASNQQQQQQNWWAYQQGYNYPSAQNQSQAGPSGAQQAQSSDTNNVNMMMPAMMMQSMMFMQQAMFQNMMKKDGSDQQAGGSSSDPSNASHSMEGMRSMMQQKSVEFIKKK